jgi:hypothetical protein
LQQFAPGFPSQEQIKAKIGSTEALKPGQVSCGWVSFSPDESQGKK